LAAALKSWASALLMLYVLRPAVLTGFVWLAAASIVDVHLGIRPTSIVFLMMALFINSRFGYNAAESFAELLELVVHQVRFNLLRRLYGVVHRFFQNLSDLVLLVIHWVDEQLRFQATDSSWTKGARATLGLVWMPLALLLRFFFTVVVEPNINPIKLAIAFIAFKAMLPFTTLITHAIRASLEPTLGVIAAGAVAWNTVFFAIPGAIAFLVWEIKENWNLFRSNRAPRLETASVGAHGESILQLLHPGFHSGIVPSLCAKLRSAELAAYETGVWRAARTYRHHLEEIADDVQRFVDREFLGLLRESPAWKGRTIVVKEVRLACNCLRIDFADAAHPESIVCFSLEDRAGWLLADLLDAGWLDRIPADARAVFDRAAVGFF
ncbi:MAG: hypothetical protein ACRDD1_17440, partial [Planctomycetia bacterium]